MWLLDHLINVLWAKLERGALEQWLHRKNSILFFISLDRRSDAKINHQINISSNTTFDRTLRKYSFDGKLCMRPWWSNQVRWLTDRFEITACVFRTLLALLAYLTACSHEEATWTHASTGAKALPAVSTNTVWDWSCVTLYPHTTSYFSWQHQHLSTSYGMLDGTLLLKWDSALCGVYDRGMRESLCRYVWRHVHLTPLRPYTALVAGASPPEGIFTLLPYFLCRVQ